MPSIMIGCWFILQIHMLIWEWMAINTDWIKFFLVFGMQQQCMHPFSYYTLCCWVKILEIKLSSLHLECWCLLCFKKIANADWGECASWWHEAQLGIIMHPNWFAKSWKLIIIRLLVCMLADNPQQKAAKRGDWRVPLNNLLVTQMMAVFDNKYIAQ